MAQGFQNLVLFLDVVHAGLIVTLTGLDCAYLAILLADNFPNDRASSLAKVLEHLESTVETLLLLEASRYDQMRSFRCLFKS